MVGLSKNKKEKKTRNIQYKKIFEVTEVVRVTFPKAEWLTFPKNIN